MNKSNKFFNIVSVTRLVISSVLMFFSLAIAVPVNAQKEEPPIPLSPSEEAQVILESVTIKIAPDETITIEATGRTYA